MGAVKLLQWYRWHLLVIRCFTIFMYCLNWLGKTASPFRPSDNDGTNCTCVGRYWKVSMSRKKESNSLVTQCTVSNGFIVYTLVSRSVINKLMSQVLVGLVSV